MTGCCLSLNCKDFKYNLEETENGLSIKITAHDPKKLESLKNLIKSCQDLCCCDDNKEKCC